MNWWRGSEHTTFKLGGPAKFFIEPKDTAELRLILGYVRKYKLSLFVIGAGSNILIRDKGIDGVVLQLSSPYFREFIFNGKHLKAGSGVMLSQLLNATEKQGLSGLEFLAGIPATVGGALIMNAGISGKSKNIGSLVENVTVMNYNGNIKLLKKQALRFGYRTSNLSKYIILNARLNLFKKDKQTVKNRIAEYINYRKVTQDISKPSAGCIFKNPKMTSAGRLIDLCGLKGKRIGGACISKRHANFILNLGNARASDVLRLMNLIIKRVKNKFNVTLEPEIKIW